MIKNIFFDFDGVIADSVNVKTEAFRTLYLKYGDDVAEKVVAHHRANGGMSRFEKFKLYHREFLGIELTSDDIEKLSASFSMLVKNGVISAPEVKGSHEFIERNCKKFNMFVVTGTPTEESKEICKERGIFNCFKGIYGSPQKKDFWTKHILNKFSLKNSESIFVGDALADYNAAIVNNIVFFLREYHENIDLFRDKKNIYRFNDFNDFEKILEKL